ncbi:DUF2631 domain-containing protein [Nocardia jinanensis]|uniref:DUF2631 domain-containing protein n=1 Tax=Nocardia jinanensis TaxID=382504 RepID=A0A917VL36_9NOCA|nr:DUF2631 domain-containing protein [Nocardia jinanensis]GGK96195.1 hypothetical protein GCM10011588_08230 [Nocardia jinanensis]
MAATEVETTSDKVVTKVDPAEVPSAAWGWSGESRRTFQVAAVVVIIILLGMLVGNHDGKVEDLYLIGFAAALAILVIRDAVLRRKPR